MQLIDPNGLEKGSLAEAEFKKWLEKNNLPYLYIKQDKETFSSIFRNNMKRPDFIILISNLGLIMVDVKHRDINKNQQTFPLDTLETEKFSVLQRNFNIPVWYAISNDNVGYRTWFWIPISKVLETGVKTFKSTKSHQGFFSISIDQFTQISYNDSLERLFSGNL